MRPTRSAPNYPSWAAHQFFLFLFQPSAFVQETRSVVKPADRLGYLIKFLVLPCLIIVISALVVALICRQNSIHFNPSTAASNLFFGMLMGVLIGVPVGMKWGIPYGLMFGMACGVMTGWVFSIWTTVPLPHNYLFPNRPLSGQVNMAANPPFFDPRRDVWVAGAMGILGGIYFQTVARILVSETRAITFGALLGAVYTLSVVLLVQPSIGLLCGSCAIVLFSMGFAHRNRLLGSMFISAAFGASFGLPIFFCYASAPQPLYNPAFGGWVFLATTLSFFVSYQRYILYPFQSLATTILYFSIGKRGSAIEQWRRCPLYWDETINLSIPYITEFLIQVACEDAKEGLRQMMFLIEKRPAYRTIAIDALAVLVPEAITAASVEEIVALDDRTSWIAEIPDALLPGLSKSLSDFEQISNLLKRYGSLADLEQQRRRAILDEAVKQASALENSLHVRDAESPVKLVDAAAAWTGVVLQEREKYPAPIPQTFVYGPPLDAGSESFAGRREIFTSIEKWCLSSPQNRTISFFGPRRMGKTSLINQLSRNLSLQIIPVTITCLDGRVTASLESHIQVFGDRILQELELRGIQYAALDVSDGAREPFTALAEWLQGALNSIGRHKLLVCIDEYEKLEEVLHKPWGKALFNNFRYLMSNYQQLALLFAGAKSVDTLGPAWTDVFIEAHSIRIGFLKEEEVRTLLMQNSDHPSMTYEEGSIELILEQTHCQPYLVQAVGGELIDKLNIENRNRVTREDVEEIISDILGLARNYFANCWSDFGEEGRAILTAMVTNSSNGSDGQESKVPEFPAARKRLILDDVITRDGKFVVPIFEKWVTQRVLIDD